MVVLVRGREEKENMDLNFFPVYLSFEKWEKKWRGSLSGRDRKRGIDRSIDRRPEREGKERIFGFKSEWLAIASD